MVREGHSEEVTPELCDGEEPIVGWFVVGMFGAQGTASAKSWSQEKLIFKNKKKVRGGRTFQWEMGGKVGGIKQPEGVLVGSGNGWEPLECFCWRKKHDLTQVFNPWLLVGVQIGTTLLESKLA